MSNVINKNPGVFRLSLTKLIALTVALAAIANACLLAGSLLELRLAGALALGIALPGALLVGAFFPHRYALRFAERIVLSAGAGMAMLVSVWWVLFLLPLTLSLADAVAGLDVVLVLLVIALLAANRQSGAPAASGRVQTRRDLRTFIGMAVVCGAALTLVMIRLNHGEYTRDEFAVVTRAMDVLMGKESSLYGLTKGPAQILLVMNMIRLGDSYAEWVLRLPFALSAVIAAGALFVLGRSRLSVPQAMLLGFLCITQGTLLGMARWVQYQMFVLAMAELALLCAWRGYQTRHSGHAQRYWLLAAIFGGSGLLGHYDAGLIAPALAYLFLKTYQERLRSLRPWLIAGQLSAVALIICVPFYVLYLREPSGLGALISNYVDDRVNLAHAPFSKLGEFATNIWDFESGYRATLIFALIGVGALAAILARRRSLSRLVLGLLAVSFLGVVITIAQPAALSIGNLNLSVVPFTILAILVLRFLVSDPFWVAILLWAFAVFGFTGFLMERPYDHYFIGLPPLIVMAVGGLRWLSGEIRRAAGPAGARRAQWAMTVALLGWLVLVTSYTVLENITFLPSYVYFHPEETPWLFPQLLASTQQTPAFYGSSVGWRTLAMLYQAGDLRGEFESTVEASPDFYFARIWAPPTPAPRYFFDARPQIPGFAKRLVPPDLQETHHLWGVIRVDGEPQIKIYQRNDGSPVAPVRTFDDAAYRNAWQQTATISRLEQFKSNHRDDSAFYAAGKLLLKQGRAGDALLIDRPEAQAVFDQFYTGTLPYIGADDTKQLSAYQRVWAIFWDNNPLGAERALAATAYPTTLQWISNLRVRTYGVANDAPLAPNGSHFGDAISLVQSAAPPAQLHPGELLPLRWQWRAEDAVPNRYKVFVHVSNAQGAPLAQYDGEPVADLRPTSSWQVHELIDDRIGIWLPGDMPAGQYQVTMGLYDPDSGERLPAVGPDGARFPDDALRVGSIAVSAR